MGIDGCSIPTYAVPLASLAYGFAKFGSGVGLTRPRAEAARRVRAAVARHPFMVAGTGRFDTQLMERLGERAFVKTGAEGVYCASLPDLGYGIALKMDDGGTRASQAVMGAVILKLLGLRDEERSAVRALAQPTLHNWNGIAVGEVRTVGPLTVPA
jgi:L-asparaginase II